MSLHRDILLVEDDTAIAELLCRVLVRAGYTVRVAADGMQALAALSKNTPTVLILDLILPGANGFTILQHLHDQHITIPVVIITGNPIYYDSLRYAGIQHVLIKPFRIEELLHTLDMTGLSATA